MMATLKLCTVCGEPCVDGRCADHRREREPKPSAHRRGYGSTWQRLSQRARRLQPWCSDCGTKDDLTADHLRWPARTLKDVDVVCRPCNTRRGPARGPNAKGRGEGADEVGKDHRGLANNFTQFGTQFRNAGG